MSLAICFYNSHGIIMSADKRIVSAINRLNGITESIVVTDAEQKLFKLSDQCGLSVTGSFSFSGVPVSSILTNYIKLHNVNMVKPEQYLLQLARYILSLHDVESDNCILMLAGYRNTIPFIISTGTKEINIVNHINSNDHSAVAYSGENEIMNVLINSKQFAYDYAKFPMQDAIDFVKFMTKTVSGLQRFQQRIQTVSEECDIFHITPYTSRWISNQFLH